jgi:hypothetical protein
MNTFYNVADALIFANPDAWAWACKTVQQALPVVDEIRPASVGVHGDVERATLALMENGPDGIRVDQPVAFTYAQTILQCRTEGNGYRVYL